MKSLKEIIADMRERVRPFMIDGDVCNNLVVPATVLLWADELEAIERESPIPDDNWKERCEKCCENGLEEDEHCEFYGEPNGCNSPIYGQHPKTAIRRNCDRFNSGNAVDDACDALHTWAQEEPESKRMVELGIDDVVRLRWLLSPVKEIANGQV